MCSVVDTTCDAVVVGAGFSGLYALQRLRDLGVTARAFEAAGDVGGTWWWNRYPGARCDIESMDYSYSFSAELQADWEWSERYATQPEILDYANHVADRFDLRRDVQFGTRVTSASWDSVADRWNVATDRDDHVSARFLILAVGVLSQPKVPDIPGLDRFAGATYFTSRWPHHGVDFTGRRVAVIGTGSSAIQAIPLIAEQAAALTVFQRTAAFSMPAHNAPLDPEFVATRKASYEEYRKSARVSHIGVVIPPTDDLAATADPSEREARFRRAWDEGLLFGVAASYADILIDPVANEHAGEFIRDRIREAVHDPAVAEALLPRTYPYATKRACLDTGYYETFNRENVALVNLRESPIVEIDEAGIVTTAGRHDADMLVLAIGFDAQTGPLLAIDPVGTGGLALHDKWAAGARNYLGLTTAGFPNLFMITGPGSPSVLTNMMMAIEQHVEWVTECVAWMRREGKTRIDATVEAEEGWVAHVAEVAEHTLYPRADSWYTGANVPGKPRVFLPYIAGLGFYRQLCDSVAAAGYAGFTLT
jgi:cyclohexanone monooxygenase